ncbi:hypothetical protein [Sinosporangium siamense]|uniref:Uncharacterized protein n=1 Tax=Sinosporangium siamense TaxID=1367973 RepID=A0A919RE99_9ACTN|nr:hypothetical protein [Sinosporangium siamense]GII92033.1 hypothetical protein Ssi02_22640 [Sinosporangium siamense]
MPRDAPLSRLYHSPPSGLPGAVRLARVRAGARASGRVAVSVLAGSVGVMAAVQMIAARVPGGGAAPFAVVALALAVAAVPALAVTQIRWGRAARGAARLERELFAREPARLGARRVASRLLTAAGWGVALLLALALPRLLAEAGLPGVAEPARHAAATVGAAGVTAGAGFVLWWMRDAWVVALRAMRGAPPPGDPWDPGYEEADSSGAVLSFGAVSAVTALVAGRAHLWVPSTVLIYALLFGALAALIAWNIVTGE